MSFTINFDESTNNVEFDVTSSLLNIGTKDGVQLHTTKDIFWIKNQNSCFAVKGVAASPEGSYAFHPISNGKGNHELAKGSLYLEMLEPHPSTGGSTKTSTGDNPMKPIVK